MDTIVQSLTVTPTADGTGLDCSTVTTDTVSGIVINNADMAAFIRAKAAAADAAAAAKAAASPPVAAPAAA